MKRLKFVMIVVCLMIATMLASGQTLAYYSTVGKSTNVITSGDIRMVIRERTDEGTDFPREGVYVAPGDVVSKIVTVENTCTHPFYLKMQITDAVRENTLLSDGCLKLDIDTENWTFVDGFYYYNEIVEPGTATSPLFTQAEIIGEKVDNSYLGKTFLLSVTAYAVQSENNPASHPWEAAGWPAEEVITP